MSPRYMEALSEVDYVLNMMEPNEVIKIPENFRSFITDNKDKRHTVSSLENLREETLAILAIIYRKFLASSEERVQLEKEFQERLKKEKANKKKNEQTVKIEYSYKLTENNSEIKEKKNSELVNYIEIKWYNKLFEKIKNIFRKNNSK